ncbi:MAG: preprotein translocase subunit YajC, partial [Pseudomonas sp.]
MSFLIPAAYADAAAPAAAATGPVGSGFEWV